MRPILALCIIVCKAVCKHVLQSVETPSLYLTTDGLTVHLWPEGMGQEITIHKKKVLIGQNNVFYSIGAGPGESRVIVKRELSISHMRRARHRPYSSDHSSSQDRSTYKKHSHKRYEDHSSYYQEPSFYKEHHSKRPPPRKHKSHRSYQSYRPHKAKETDDSNESNEEESAQSEEQASEYAKPEKKPPKRSTRQSRVNIRSSLTDTDELDNDPYDASDPYDVRIQEQGGGKIYFTRISNGHCMKYSPGGFFFDVCTKDKETIAHFKIIEREKSHKGSAALPMPSIFDPATNNTSPQAFYPFSPIPPKSSSDVINKVSQTIDSTLPGVAKKQQNTPGIQSGTPQTNQQPAPSQTSTCPNNENIPPQANGQPSLQPGTEYQNTATPQNTYQNYYGWPPKGYTPAQNSTFSGTQGYSPAQNVSQVYPSSTMPSVGSYPQGNTPMGPNNFYPSYNTPKYPYDRAQYPPRSNTPMKAYSPRAPGESKYPEEYRFLYDNEDQSNSYMERPQRKSISSYPSLDLAKLSTPVFHHSSSHRRKGRSLVLDRPTLSKGSSAKGETNDSFNFLDDVDQTSHDTYGTNDYTNHAYLKKVHPKRQEAETTTKPSYFMNTEDKESIAEPDHPSSHSQEQNLPYYKKIKNKLSRLRRMLGTSTGLVSLPSRETYTFPSDSKKIMKKVENDIIQELQKRIPTSNANENESKFHWKTPRKDKHTKTPLAQRALQEKRVEYIRKGPGIHRDKRVKQPYSTSDTFFKEHSHLEDPSLISHRYQDQIEPDSYGGMERTRHKNERPEDFYSRHSQGHYENKGDKEYFRDQSTENDRIRSISKPSHSNRSTRYRTNEMYHNQPYPEYQQRTNMPASIEYSRNKLVPGTHSNRMQPQREREKQMDDTRPGYKMHQMNQMTPYSYNGLEDKSTYHPEPYYLRESVSTNRPRSHSEGDSLSHINTASSTRFKQERPRHRSVPRLSGNTAKAKQNLDLLYGTGTSALSPAIQSQGQTPATIQKKSMSDTSALGNVANNLLNGLSSSSSLVNNQLSALGNNGFGSISGRSLGRFNDLLGSISSGTTNTPMSPKTPSFTVPNTPVTSSTLLSPGRNTWTDNRSGSMTDSSLRGSSSSVPSSPASPMTVVASKSPSAVMPISFGPDPSRSPQGYGLGNSTAGNLLSKFEMSLGTSAPIENQLSSQGNTSSSIPMVSTTSANGSTLSVPAVSKKSPVTGGGLAQGLGPVQSTLGHLYDPFNSGFNPSSPIQPLSGAPLISAADNPVDTVTRFDSSISLPGSAPLLAAANPILASNSAVAPASNTSLASSLSTPLLSSTSLSNSFASSIPGINDILSGTSLSKLLNEKGSISSANTPIKSKTEQGTLSTPSISSSSFTNTLLTPSIEKSFFPEIPKPLEKKKETVSVASSNANTQNLSNALSTGLNFMGLPSNPFLSSALNKPEHKESKDSPQTQGTTPSNTLSSGSNSSNLLVNSSLSSASTPNTIPLQSKSLNTTTAPSTSLGSGLISDTSLTESHPALDTFFKSLSSNPNTSSGTDQNSKSPNYNSLLQFLL
ncbi:hypothetical protein NEOKW01_1774 [Nematocida sp. AWRm80]|nr:hypothetical protein NEOKW01_1774 [Nematocida sp. AWRm80]